MLKTILINLFNGLAIAGWVIFGLMVLWALGIVDLSTPLLWILYGGNL